MKQAVDQGNESEAAKLSELNAGLDAEQYFAAFSNQYHGWCVFKRKGGLFAEFYAGAYSGMVAAKSEARRLNRPVTNSD